MSAFNSMCSKVRDRNWGGTNINVAAEPYISGYSFMRFLHMPQGLLNDGTINKLGVNQSSPKTDYNHTTNAPEEGNFRGRRGMADFLEHAMNSVTPPGGTINKVEFAGLGGSKWAVPGSMDYQNSISIKYYEFSGLPIARIHRAWCSLIRDNRMGLTHLNNNQSPSYSNKAYNKQNYGATLAYWTTKPDGVTVEFAAIYTGLFPTKDPMDLFSGDIQSIDKLEIEIEYNVDMIYNDNSAFSYCQNLASEGKAGTYTQDETIWSGTTGKWDGSTGYRGMNETFGAAQNR